MPIYRVNFRILGSILVDTNGPVAASYLVRRSTPMLNHKKLQLSLFEVSPGIEVDEVTLLPDDVSQKSRA